MYFALFVILFLKRFSQQVSQPIVPLDPEFAAIGIFHPFIPWTSCREWFQNNKGSAGQILQTIFFRLSLRPGHHPSVMQRLNSFARSLGESNKAVEAEGKKRKKTLIQQTMLVFEFQGGGNSVYGKGGCCVDSA